MVNGMPSCIARDGFEISNGDGGCDYIGGRRVHPPAPQRISAREPRLLIIAALDD